MGKNEKTNMQILLEEAIKQEFSDSGLYKTESDYFEYFASSQVLKDYDLTIDEISSGIIGSGGDGGCDSIYLFLNGNLVTSDQVQKVVAGNDSILEFVVLQAKKTDSFSEDAIMKWKTVSSSLLQLSSTSSKFTTRYNSSLLDAYRDFKNLYKRLIKNKVNLVFSFYYVTLASTIHPNVAMQAEELKDVVRQQYPASKINVEFIGADALFTFYQRRSEVSLNLPLVGFPIAIGQKNDYVSLVKLSNFYEFITDDSNLLKKRLFEANVRDYQGKNNVNTCIQETLANKTEEDFWWLNNGITILASGATLVSNQELQLNNPVIVNGLQTSNEIYNYYSKNRQKLGDEDRNILVRVIVPKSEESRNNIIFATNNQTNISKATLRVTDPIHLQIEMYFKARGLYYDRRKNYYKNEGRKPSDIIGVSFLGQCLISLFLRKPDYARARPSTLLNDEVIYKQLYQDNNDLEVFYKCAVIGKRVQRNINLTELFNPAEKSDLLFYVIFAVVAMILNKVDITAGDIKGLDLDLVNSKSIDKAKEEIYSRYKLAGGNGRVAKSKEFTKTVIDEILI